MSQDQSRLVKVNGMKKKLRNGTDNFK